MQHDKDEPGAVHAARQWTTYDFVMLLYLLTGAWLLPLVVGEILVAAGLIRAMNEQTMPSWLYGYVVLTTFLAAFALFIAWLPALLICLRFWKRWRAVVPAAALIALVIGLFLLPDGAVASTVINAAAVVYTFVAFCVGLEWYLRGRPRR
jgi:hypothetical protein